MAMKPNGDSESGTKEETGQVHLRPPLSLMERLNELEEELHLSKPRIGLAALVVFEAIGESGRSVACKYVKQIEQGAKWNEIATALRVDLGHLASPQAKIVKGMANALDTVKEGLRRKSTQ